jgi:predicted metal-binding membrane protein
VLAQDDTPMPDSMMPGLFDAAAFVAAWAIMMTAMMLPSAIPMIALYGVVQRNMAGAGQRAVSQAVFTSVYVAVWAAVGVPIYLASIVVARQSAARNSQVPYALAAVLILGGLYQFTPLKRACLRLCRNPLSFLLERTRSGYRGSLQLGLEHAGYCVGCCWALMVVLVAAGAMALNWSLLIAALVFLEKVVPRGERSAAAAGAVLLLLGVAAAVHPDLAMALCPHA